MRVFVGFGYNDRDLWIEQQVLPILRHLGFVVVHGQDMHGEVLQPEVKARIAQSDAVIGFMTLRDGQGEADFNSHIWVRDELVHADATGKSIIVIKEADVRMPEGILANRQHIPLNQQDRLACVAELLHALGRRNMRLLKLDPEEDQLRRDIMQWRKTEGFVIRYRTQDSEGTESGFKDGRLEVVDQGFYLNVSDVPKRAYVEVEGLLNGDLRFSSGWVSADAVQVRVF